MEKNPAIKPEDAKEIMASWEACLPGEISNLFYYIPERNASAQRYNNYFSLGEDGISDLLNFDPFDPHEPIDPNTLPKIQIHMGCRRVIDEFSGDAMSTFTPLLSIASNGDKDYYELKYVPEAPKHTKSFSLVEIHPHLRLDPISSGVAELFCMKWKELSDEQLADAFSGETANKVLLHQLPPNGEKVAILQGLPSNQRVRSYDFSVDVAHIIQDLHNSVENGIEPYFHLRLGAGLTVRLTHPFNFRPIITVSKPKPPTLAYENGDGDGPGEGNYERSLPCPPYCPNGDGD